MVNVLKSLRNTAILISLFTLSLIILGGSSAYAAQAVTVDPYDDLPVAGASTLTVSGTGLVPGARVNMLQVATKGSVNGIAVEQLHKGSVIVSADGSFQTTVSVTYDVRSPGVDPLFTECNNKDSTLVTRESCYLEVFYMENYGTADRIIVQQKLYFGMTDPNKVTPPPVSIGPMSKEDCHDDKWNTFTTLAFKNQGACVSFVAKQQ